MHCLVLGQSFGQDSSDLVAVHAPQKIRSTQHDDGATLARPLAVPLEQHDSSPAVAVAGCGESGHRSWKVVRGRCVGRSRCTSPRLNAGRAAGLDVVRTEPISTLCQAVEHIIEGLQQEFRVRCSSRSSSSSHDAAVEVDPPGACAPRWHLARMHLDISGQEVGSFYRIRRGFRPAVAAHWRHGRRRPLGQRVALYRGDGRQAFHRRRRERLRRQQQLVRCDERGRGGRAIAKRGPPSARTSGRPRATANVPFSTGTGLRCFERTDSTRRQRDLRRISSTFSAHAGIEFHAQFQEPHMRAQAHDNASPAAPLRQFLRLPTVMRATGWEAQPSIG